MSAWTLLVGAQVSLAPGATYAAKVQLTGIEATFGTEDAVKAKFEGVGFSHVGVTSDAPPGFPDTAHFGDGATFFVVGVWEGAAAAKALPSQVKLVWKYTGSEPDVEPDADPSPNLPPPPAPGQGPTVQHLPADEKAAPSDDDWMLIAVLLTLLFMGSQH